MKRTARIAFAAWCVCAAALPAAAQAPQPVPPKTAPATHVTKDQIQEFIAHMAPDRIADSADPRG